MARPRACESRANDHCQKHKEPWHTNSLPIHTRKNKVVHEEAPRNQGHCHYDRRRNRSRQQCNYNGNPDGGDFANDWNQLNEARCYSDRQSKGQSRGQHGRCDSCGVKHDNDGNPLQVREERTVEVGENHGGAFVVFHRQEPVEQPLELVSAQWSYRTTSRCRRWSE